MEEERKTSLVFITAIAALVGLVSGAIGSFLVAGLPLVPRIQSFFTEPVGEELTQEQVDEKIVELVEEESATISVVERVTPAVVSVVIRKPRQDIAMYDPFDYFYFGYPEPVEPDLENGEELVEIGGGTGFFATSDGLIVTNRHVVEDGQAVYTVVTDTGEELPADVLAIDPFFDIAVMKVEGNGFPTVTFGDSDKIQIGQTVIAIGNTLSEYRNTVTKGVVSGINRYVSAGDMFGGTEVIEEAIQTDAAINPGNSGGPLINLFGEVVGINTAISVEGEGVGFAIPINEVRQVVEDVEQFGRIVRPWLGVRYVTLTPVLAAEEGLSVEEGALLVAGANAGEVAVVEGSPAEAAHLQEGDVIVRINEIDLDKDTTLADVVRDFEPGESIRLSVLRGADSFEISVTLAEFDAGE